MPRLTAGSAQLLVGGGGHFLADLDLPGALEVCFVRSPLPHARLGSIAGAGASAGDLDLEPIVIEGPGLTPRPWLALPADTARYVGEPVAAVWAGDRYLAEDLADKVEVEYKELDLEEPAVLFEQTFTNGAVQAAFGRAELQIERTFRTGRVTPLPLECRGAAASFDEATGEVELWTSTQIPNLVARGVAAALRMDESKVRVLVPHVGGGFGLKAHLFAEEIVLAALARKLGRTVRWVEDRRENLIASAHAHDNQVRLTAALTGDGRVVAVRAEVTSDVGAYSIYPFSASLEPATTAQTIFGPYALEAYVFSARGLSSNKCPVGAYRGVGMNTGVYVTERLMDEIAAELRIDPLELRKRNAIQELPATTHARRELDSGDYPALLARLEDSAGYAELRREQESARSQGRLFGIGIGFFNEHSGTGSTDYKSRGITSVPGFDAARVRVTEEGRVEILTSAAEAGQGHAETYRRLAEEIGIEPGRVDVIEGDTRECPPGSGTFASRGAVGVVEAVVQALREAAELDLAPGTDVVKTIDPTQVFPSGAHLAVVEVDPVSLVPQVRRYIAIEDCGRVIDHAVVEGQVRGGVAMGIGDVLMEEHVYGADGQILTSSLLDYLVPLAADVPSVEMHHLESATPRTTRGSKGVGEAGVIGAYGAVSNAVADAIRPLGAELTDLPYSPARIFAALEKVRAQ